MGAHARLGPSNKRWPKCAASADAEAPYPDTAGKAAIDGTGSHELLEMCLKNGVRAEVYDMQVICQGHEDSPNGWLVDSDRCKRVQIALDYVAERVAQLKVLHKSAMGEPTVEVFAESISNPGEPYGRDDWWGICDITFIVTHANGRDICFVEVADYKDGRGYVSEKSNTQLISYLHGKTCEITDNINTRMTIIQPKTKNIIRFEDRDLLWVQAEADKLAAAAMRTDEVNPSFVEGNHCQWCKHGDSGNCEAKNNKAIEVIRTMENNGVIEQVHSHLQTMEGDALAKILDSQKIFEDAFMRARVEAERRINAGETVNGWTVAPGNDRRVWAEDEEVIAKKLKGMKLNKDEVYPAKLITPTQAEKHEALTDKQRVNVQKLITTIVGKMGLKKTPRVDAVDVFSGVDEAPAAELPAPELPSFL